jgi:hypothetical protein
MHERRAIREAVIASLLNATDAGARVSKSRIAPLPTTELPAISVYGSDEAVDPASRETAPRELKRSVSITIDAWVLAPPAPGGLDDVLDDGLCLQIETALDLNPVLGLDVVDDVVLVSTEIGQDLTGARPMGVARMTFDVRYYTQRRVRAAMEALDDFNTMDVKYPKIDGAHPLAAPRRPKG